MRRLLVTAALIAAPAWAQDAVPQAYHDDTPSDIVVTAPYARDRVDILSGTAVMSGIELTRQLKPTIGDTLIGQPGVSATSFGPNASRPVLRGFQGDRVRVLTDGIGSFDVSNTSVDHAVVINPLTAERIEVLRGPSALLFGSSAIGGVVNVIDARIPRRVPDEPVHADLIGTLASAADERSGGGSVDLPAGGKLVLHMDGSWLETGDLATGGYILSPALRAQAAASLDADIRALANLKGKLPNSAARTWDLAGGAAIVTDGGNLGFAVSRYDSLYGVPIRYSLDPAVDAEQTRLDVRQTRFDLRAESDIPSGPFSRVRFRGGFADYRHDELEENGSVGTTFLNQGWEGRLELVQRARGGWQGAIGGQVVLRNLNIVGDEKFLPKSEARQYGLFALETFDLGMWRAEVGARYEHSAAQADADAVLGNPALARSFDAFSASAGASLEIAEGWRLGLNLTHAERAPSVEELFANGPHAGTQAFEIGDPDFVKERSNGAELTLKGKGDGYSLSLGGYYSRFADFIYEDATGAVMDGLPVFQSRQAGATYYGAEAEGSAVLARVGDTTLNFDTVADYTHATIADVGPAPRIPPLRVLGGIEAQSPLMDGRVEVEWTDAQRRVAAFETETDGFTLVNASLAFHPKGHWAGTNIVLSANNLFDVDARRHASFLKDYAPLAGRDIRLSVRVTI